VAGDAGDPPGDDEQRPDSPVLVALEVKSAALELIKFTRLISSLGLASWAVGVGFAGTAVGLRFVDRADMAAPEFVSCFVLASILVAFGSFVYVLEARGYIRLASEITATTPSPLISKNGAGPATKEVTGGTSAPPA
jgi:hypothetical protein